MKTYLFKVNFTNGLYLEKIVYEDEVKYFIEKFKNDFHVNNFTYGSFEFKKEKKKMKKTKKSVYYRINGVMNYQGLDSKMHPAFYVKVPENHIVIDFDIKDDSGHKSLEKNLEAASKSGQGIHLHYVYDGDVTKLNIIKDLGSMKNNNV